MGKHRPSGDGMVRLRESGRWECRMVVSHKENGDSIFHYVSSDTQKKMLNKLHRDMDAYWSADLSEESRNPGGATAPPHPARRDTDHRRDQDLCGNPGNHPTSTADLLHQRRGCRASGSTTSDIPSPPMPWPPTWMASPSPPRSHQHLLRPGHLRPRNGRNAAAGGPGGGRLPAGHLWKRAETMAKSGKRGGGSSHLRKDGRWEGGLWWATMSRGTPRQRTAWPEQSGSVWKSSRLCGCHARRLKRKSAISGLACPSESGWTSFGTETAATPASGSTPSGL